ncbi:MAG: FISUMP domain-containing protein [Perlabentimonas sp.]
MKRRIIIPLSFMVMALCLKAQTPTEMPTGTKFYIQSAMNYGKNNGGYWDIPGKPNSIKKGSNIQVWNLDSGADRMFTLHQSSERGYYEIQIGNTSKSRVDIQGRKTNNGTSVKTWESNGQTNQRFLFHHLGNGRFKVFDKNSRKALCLAGRKNANGTNVHIWDNHNGPWMEWYLVDVKTKKAFNPDNVVKSGQKGTFKDKRDGKTYKTIAIGKQIWMAENLAYKPSNGTYWAYNNDESNVATYGYLYNWETAKKVCPAGWHLPTNNEWKELKDFVGNNTKKLRSKTHWGNANNGVSFNGTDDFGFAGLPSGKIMTDGSSDNLEYMASWWSSTETAEVAAKSWTILGNARSFNDLSSSKRYGNSVRCLKD